MAERRRGRGEDAIYFAHRAGSLCRDARHHRTCEGRWRGAVDLGFDVDGKRVRRTVSARTKTEVATKLDQLREELGSGVRSNPNYTVSDAVEDWFAAALDGRSPKTISTQRELLQPVVAQIGNTKLRDLTASKVRAALAKTTATRSSRTVRDSKAALVRAITHAQANDLVARNVAALTQAPAGQSKGRPARAFTLEQLIMVLRAAAKDRLHAYFTTSALTGVRTEEARALRWDHVVAYVDADKQWRPVTDVGWNHRQFAMRVFRSVRSSGDVKTPKSRRTVALPAEVVIALQAHQEAQEKEREAAKEKWPQHGLVFTSEVGTQLDEHNVRRSFRRICKAAGVGIGWAPRDLRHSFVSILSQQGVPVEEIARLIGHTGGSGVTERIYRKELRPVVTTGAEIMDEIMRGATPPSRVRTA